ncbi:MAG: GTPase HflX, partial [Chlamydiales bacterium]|nr:GTPase HflX [Chlamydiales bacterium]
METGQGRLVDLSPEQNKAFLVGTYQQTSAKATCLEQLDELESLCETYGLKVVGNIACPIKSYEAATFVGKGKVQEIISMVAESDANVVIFDDEISPQQQRNLELAFEKTTVDRTELILGVFAQRARSREARIQVELATLRYQMPRLRRMWTHLSRQRSGGGGGSGGGYVRGEGEKQIEIDRRLLRRRLDRLEVEL